MFSPGGKDEGPRRRFNIIPGTRPGPTIGWEEWNVDRKTGSRSHSHLLNDGDTLLYGHAHFA